MLLSLLYACEATIPNPEGAAPDKVGEGPATTAAVLARIRTDKDVDGFGAHNLGLLAGGRPH